MVILDLQIFKLIGYKVKLTNAKKLLAIKNSPILSMTADAITKRLSEIPRYSHLKIEGGRISVETEKDVIQVLKMLNDDILKSELSQVENDSPKKKMLLDS